MGFAPVSLHGRHVSLVPLSHSHHDSLVDALKDGELWTLWYTTIPTPEGLQAEIDRRLELQQQGSMIAFARHLRVQHYRSRVADGEGPSHSSTDRLRDVHH